MKIFTAMYFKITFKIKATFHRDLWVNMFWDCSLGWTKGMFESLYHVEMLIVHVREQLSPRITAVKNMRWSYSKLRKVSFLFHYLWFTAIDELKRSGSCFAFCSVQRNYQRSEKRPVTFCGVNTLQDGVPIWRASDMQNCPILMKFHKNGKADRGIISFKLYANKCFEIKICVR